MKKMLAVLVLAFAATGASAQGACELVSRLATAVMESRQHGVSMADVMKIADEAGSLRDVMFPLVKAAYGVQRFSTKEMRAIAVENFRDEAALICYRKPH